MPETFIWHSFKQSPQISSKVVSFVESAIKYIICLDLKTLNFKTQHGTMFIGWVLFIEKFKNIIKAIENNQVCSVFRIKVLMIEV